jgi:hypothetical protein
MRLITLLLCIVACSSDHTAFERDAILRLYASIGRAHLAHDSAGFVAPDADTVLNIANGQLHSRTRAEGLAGVGEYLRGRMITEVTELDPPRVTVAPDGRSATLIGHVRVSGTLGSKPFTFTAAWLDLLRKDETGWHIFVHANTEGP